ncbi:50S ribosomal protein L10 [Promethearchaeum syntrophicum]|uniref:50S ribosomal protein L10 n=1 Tax=Promethearchaeum syntrophicum TaxID=2594042 RepID=A0A5B9DB35_9ARCH
MVQRGKVSTTKIQEVEKISALVKDFKVIGLAKLEKVPAKALHNLRDTLRGDVIIRMSKKKLIQKAFKASKKKNLTELADNILGITAMLFTNMNPIKLAQFLESKAVKGPAKPGDLAPGDIVVKAGDTKIAPGPIISELSQNLKLQTLIKNGTIHIREDKVTHTVGQLIDTKQAQLLGRLGLEPMTIKLDFYSAWEDGEIIPTEVLHLNIDTILDNVRLAASEAINLSLELGIITSDTIKPLMAKAIRSSIALAVNLPIFIPEMVDQYMAKATREAIAINGAFFESEDQPESEEEPEPEKKEEEPSGLGNLFG